MSVDPTEPEAIEDAYEDEPDEEEPGGFETPQEDAAEQHTDLLQHRDSPMADRGLTEADPADAADQARVVELNDDEYR
ncbi:hypothetical protein [Streptomyces boncukensis]|uniref:DUF5709 domain-containing protein n=1 Tax=Streptomyces boncukensis TaxID=2711219 RepID=A0A6G4X040_9ACTN|nr:hypothetical protein [Streptomyces boncukensis]NGO70031.1 hypothetical protein [Streptomyces boncukensis]